MVGELYQEEFFYKSSGEHDYAYDLIMLPEIEGKIVVVITAKSEKASLSIAGFYPNLAKQVYFKHLQKLKATQIIWLEKILQRTSEAAFFKVDLKWDEQLDSFYCPTGSLVAHKLTF